LNAAFGVGFRRAPAVNTLRHVFLTLGRDDLEDAFRRHADALNGTVRVTGKRTIALDGKALRGSFDHLNDQQAAHGLSAFASDAALILAHLEVAFQAVLQSVPDLILTDLRMPAGGAEYISRLRKVAPHCPIVVMTAFGDPALQAEVRRAGANAYFDKPVRISELKLRIEALLNEHR
jgi:CheY-like chemotaxis protein